MVCDEADNLLDMGFRPTIIKILQCLPPKQQRQSLLFSATFPGSVKELANFALKVRLLGSARALCDAAAGAAEGGVMALCVVEATL